MIKKKINEGYLVQNKSCCVVNSQCHVLISTIEDDGAYEIIDIITRSLSLCLLLHSFRHILTSHEYSSSVTWKSKVYYTWLVGSALNRDVF